MPRLSILVPKLGAVKPFEDTLASVLQNRPGGCQILVAHAGAYDDPWSLGDEVEFVEQSDDASLVDLLNAGLNEVRAEVLHIVLGGTEATDGWTSAAVRHFADPRVAAVSPLVVDASDRQRIVGRGVQYGFGGRRRIVDAGRELKSGEGRDAAVLGPLLQAGFYRTDSLLDIGGFEPLVGGELADLDVALTIDAVGLRCVHEPHSVLLGTFGEPSPGSFEAGQQAERLYWRHQSRRGGLASLIVHPMLALFAALGDLPHPGACTQLFGRLAAITEWAQFRKFEQALNELATMVADELADSTSSRNDPRVPSDQPSRRAA